MSKLVSRVKDFKDKALKVKAAIEQAPQAVAQIRQSVENTKAELQQLKGEIQSGAQELAISDLKADFKATFETQDNGPAESRAKTKPNLSEAIRELNSSKDMLHKAGCQLQRVEIETQGSQSLTVCLKLQSAPSVLILQNLHKECSDKPILRSLLASLIQAESLIRSYTLDQLSASEVHIRLGQSSGLRVIWERSSQSLSGSSGSFFERREREAPQPSTVQNLATTAPQSLPSELQATVTEAIQSSRAALDRFKQNPKFSKYK